MPQTRDLPPEYHRFSGCASKVRDLIDLLSIEEGMPPDAIEGLSKVARRLQDHAGSFIPPAVGMLKL